jgi:hypothetical protein
MLSPEWHIEFQKLFATEDILYCSVFLIFSVAFCGLYFRFQPFFASGIFISNVCTRLMKIHSPQRTTENKLRAAEDIHYCYVFLIFSVALCGLYFRFQPLFGLWNNIFNVGTHLLKILSPQRATEKILRAAEYTISAALCELIFLIT